jgi:hypothetical protein
MKFDDSLFIQILEQLSKVYPQRFSNDGQILPDYKDHEEIKRHLAYCQGDGRITFKEVWMSDGTLNIQDIRITNNGIDYLLRKSQEAK